MLGHFTTLCMIGLRGLIGKGKVYLIYGKKQWAHEKVDKASNKTINKAYAKYEQHELNENAGNTRKALDKPVISMYLTGLSQVVKMRDVQKLQHNIKTDPVITDQMENLGCLLAYTFINFLALVLVAAHTFNSLNLGMKMKVAKMIKYTRNSVSSAYAELQDHIEKQNFSKVAGATNG